MMSFPSSHQARQGFLNNPQFTTLITKIKSHISAAINRKHCDVWIELHHSEVKFADDAITMLKNWGYNDARYCSGNTYQNVGPSISFKLKREDTEHIFDKLLEKLRMKIVESINKSNKYVAVKVEYYEISFVERAVEFLKTKYPEVHYCSGGMGGYQECEPCIYITLFN